MRPNTIIDFIDNLFIQLVITHSKEQVGDQLQVLCHLFDINRRIIIQTVPLRVFEFGFEST